jgi:hypothetical protein
MDIIIFCPWLDPMLLIILLRVLTPALQAHVLVYTICDKLALLLCRELMLASSVVREDFNEVTSVCNELILDSSIVRDNLSDVTSVWREPMLVWSVAWADCTVDMLPIRTNTVTQIVAYELLVKAGLGVKIATIVICFL